MDEKKILNPPELVASIQDYLNARGFSEHARYEAEQMVAEVLGTDRLGIYLQFDKPVSEPEKQRLRTMLRSRVAGLPLAYVLGAAYFDGRKYIVGPGVLIPRPDTETAVYLAEERLVAIASQNPDARIRLLDVGTGSGIIALTLAMKVPNLDVVAIDVSEQAIAIAQKNLELHSAQLRSGSTVEFTLQDMKSTGLSALGVFSIIVSNPPYVTDEECLALPEECRKHEPSEAFCGGPDGLEFYRLLRDKAPEMLEQGGWLVLEHGHLQKDAIINLFAEKSGAWRLAEARTDFNSKDRALAFEKI